VPAEANPGPSDNGRVIEIKGLTKYYGKIRGVEDLDLHVDRGEVMGFLGPNGAGKTTTIRVCLDLLSKSSGEVRIFGKDAHRHSVEIRRRTGYLPGDFGLMPDLKVRSYLKYLLSLSGVNSVRKMEELAGRLDLDLTRKNQDLSKGNRQKVGIVQAFMADQDLIILDEPTGGLDPLIQQEFYDILRDENRAGKTIFMSSHVLAEVEAVCDRVAIIRDGRLRIEERLSVLRDKMGKVMEVEFREPVDASQLRLPGVTELEVDGTRARLTILENLDDVIKAVADHSIVNMSLNTFSLEQLFLRYYGGRGDQAGEGDAEGNDENAVGTGGDA